MFTQERFNQKEFVIYFTFYNLTVFIAWIFLIAFTLNVGLNVVFKNFSIVIIMNIEQFISKGQFLWWLPITLYFNFQITKRRLADIGYSKWWALFNFYPLLFACVAMYEFLFQMGIRNISGMEYLIVAIILPIMKIGLISLLFFHPTKLQGNQDE